MRRQDLHILNLVLAEANLNTIASPCVRNCCLNEEDICIGCFRNIDEICGWSAADEGEKLKILEQVNLRRNQSNNLNGTTK